MHEGCDAPRDQRQRCGRGPSASAFASGSSTLADAMVFFPVLLFLRPRPLLAANDVAFAVLFGIFIVALLTLIVIVLTWVIRRDRQGRADWLQRQQDRNAAAEGDVPPTARP